MNSPRKIMLDILKRNRTDIVPFDIGFNPGANREFKKQLNGKIEREVFGCPTRDVHQNALAAKKKFDYFKFYKNGIPKDYSINEWGLAYHYNNNGLVEYIPSMDKFQSIEDIEQYPFPDFTRKACVTDLIRAC